MWTEPCPGLPAGDLSDSTRTPGPWLGPRVRKGQAGQRAQAGLGQAALTDTEADRREAGPGSTSPLRSPARRHAVLAPLLWAGTRAARAAAHRRRQAEGAAGLHISAQRTQKRSHTPQGNIVTK